MPEERQESVLTCPHCDSWKIRERHGFHPLARWRCRGCGGTFFKPRAHLELFSPSRPLWEGLVLGPANGNGHHPNGRQAVNGIPHLNGHETLNGHGDGLERSRNAERAGAASRVRATAIVVSQGRILLVRDHGRNHFSLPGASLHHGERPEEVLAGQLTELGLDAPAPKRLLTYKGSTRKHHVFLVMVPPVPDVPPSLYKEYLWWDGEFEVPLHQYVSRILRQAKVPH